MQRTTKFERASRLPCLQAPDFHARLPKAHDLSAAAKEEESKRYRVETAGSSVAGAERRFFNAPESIRIRSVGGSARGLGDGRWRLGCFGGRPEAQGATSAAGRAPGYPWLRRRHASERLHHAARPAGEQ